MIKVSENNGEQMVDARELHVFLGVGRVFRTWIQDRIEKYGFVEGVDYVVLEGRPELGIGHYNPKPQKDYAITLDMAKDISMAENSDKGREVRRYFKDCEKKLGQIRKQMTPLEMHLETLRHMVDMQQRTTLIESTVHRFGSAVEQIVDEIKAIKATAQVDENYVTIAGFLSLKKIKGTLPEAIKQYGIQASKYCKEHGIAISQVPSAKWGKINAYPKDVLDIVVAGRA